MVGALSFIVCRPFNSYVIFWLLAVYTFTTVNLALCKCSTIATGMRVYELRVDLRLIAGIGNLFLIGCRIWRAELIFLCEFVSFTVFVALNIVDLGRVTCYSAFLYFVI